MIKGIQKTTLVDYPGNVATIVFVGGCNFRCGYCYNKDLVQGDMKDIVNPTQETWRNIVATFRFNNS